MQNCQFLIRLQNDRNSARGIGGEIVKRKYTKPIANTELYSLNTSIASNCAIVVSNGPAVPDKYEQCSDYVDPFSTFGMRSRSRIYNVAFYEETCDCYTTGSDTGYWTS